MIKIGERLPSLSFTTKEGAESFDNLRGQWLVLYFYPKDNTPGCSIEARDFRDAEAKFRKKNARIVGVSRDSLSSHQRFQEKQAFSFPLISDESSELCHLFDVIKMKSMYGKKFEGIERSTFLIDPEGVLRKEWRKVKVTGHVDDVFQALIAFQ